MNEVPEKYYILFYNLSIDQDCVDLLPGFVLKKVSPISVFDLALAGSKGFREWAILEPIIHNCTTEAISWDTEELTNPIGYDALNRVWLFSVLLILHDMQDQYPIAYNKYSWNIFSGQTVPGAVKASIGEFSGGVLDFTLSYIHTTSKKGMLDNESYEFIRKYFISANKLAHDYEQFRLGLLSLYDWRFAKDIRVAIARLWVGIEALLNINSELSYRIALYASTVLEDRGEARKARFNEIKKLYSKRSRAVHGDSMSDEDLVDTIEKSFQLLKDLIVFCCKTNKMLSIVDIENLLLC